MAHSPEKATESIDEGQPTFPHVGHVPTRDVAVLDDRTGHIDGNVILTDKDGAVRKVPTPTSSPRDPVNFSKTSKWAIVWLTGLLFTFSVGSTSGFPALLPVFFRLYAPPPSLTPVTEIVRLATWPSLFQGAGNWFFVPIAVAWGRRPVMLLGTLIFIGSCIGGGVSKTFHAHLVSRIILGLGGGACESLVPLIVTDISFVHERATILGVANLAQNLFTLAVSLPGPYMAEQIGWRWYYWIFVILGSAIFIGLFFLVPETRFDRPAAYIDGQIIAYDAFGNPRILSDEEATEELAAGRVASDGGLATALHDEKFTFLQRINPFTRPVKDPLRVYLGVWRDMAICLLDPGCLYALGLGSIILGGVVAMSTSIASVLEDDYGWPSANTSLYIIGSTISGFLVIPFGMACDKLCLWLSKRNGGQHLPEHRLLGFIFPAILGIVSNLLYGYFCQNTDRFSWFAIVFFYSAQFLALLAAIVLTATFAVESASHRPGAALILVVGGKNLLAYAISSEISPVLTEGRFLYIHGILAGVTAGWALLGIPLWFYGPRVRAWQTKHLPRTT